MSCNALPGRFALFGACFDSGQFNVTQEQVSAGHLLDAPAFIVGRPAFRVGFLKLPERLGSDAFGDYGAPCNGPIGRPDNAIGIGHRLQMAE